MLINNLEEKLKFYKNILKNKIETYILIKNHNGDENVAYVRVGPNAEHGFYELPCYLFDYSFTKGNKKQEVFMREQGYVIINDRAYEIQTPFAVSDFEKQLGDFTEITKEECVRWLMANGEK